MSAPRRADFRIARLILFNGPPGIGKSTCARQWVADRPGSVVIEIDELRTSIDGWRDDDNSKLVARQMAIEAAGRHLRSGTDVVVPQYLGRTAFIVELEQTAHAVGAQFVEVHLVADPNEVVARFEARRAAAGADAHPQHEVEDVRAEVEDAIARLDVISAERTGAQRVASGDPAVTMARLSAVLGQ